MKNSIFTCFPISLASGVLILGITVIAITSPLNYVTDVITNRFYHIFPNAHNNKIYRDTNRK